MLLHARVAIVTGAGRGIGRAIALRFAQEGADLFVVDVDGAAAEAVAAEIRQMGRRAWAHAVDVSNVEAPGNLVRKAVEAFGRIDILVNNAGRSGPKPMLELTPEDWNSVFDLNVKGLFFCLQEAARQMIRQESPGKIINIASLAGKMPNVRHMHYAASKSAVISITQSAAAVLAPSKINVNAICPGIIATAMWVDVDKAITSAKGAPVGSEFEAAVKSIPLGRAGTPADVAGVALFLASPDSDYMTGQSLNVTGGKRMD